MRPVGKSGQSEQTGFLNQDGNSCKRVSHGNRIRESEATIQYLRVQLSHRGGRGLLSGLRHLFPSPGNENLGAVRAFQLVGRVTNLCYVMF